MRPRWLPVTIAALTLFGCRRVEVPGIAGGQASLLAYVTQFNTNAVDVVDIVRQTPIGQPITVGQGPIRAVLAPGGSQDYLYVADKIGNTVSFINRRTKSDEKDVFAGTDPEDLTFQTITDDPNPSDQQFILVSNPAARTVTRINVVGQQADFTYDYSNLKGTEAGGFTPAGIVADPKAPWVFVVSSTVEQQPGCTSNCTSTGVVDVLKNTAGGLTALTSVTLSGAIKPFRAMLDPAAANLYISDQGAAQIFQVTLGDLTKTVPTATTIPITGAPGGTWGLAISPDGTNVFTSMPSANGMEQIQLGQPKSGVIASGGTQPEPMAMSSDGNFLWIGNVGSSNIYSYDLTGIPCNAKGSPCRAQGPINYSLNTSSIQPPGDIVLAPAVP